jgi:hypothetical protein
MASRKKLAVAEKNRSNYVRAHDMLMKQDRESIGERLSGDFPPKILEQLICSAMMGSQRLALASLPWKAV